MSRLDPRRLDPRLLAALSGAATVLGLLGLLQAFAVRPLSNASVLVGVGVGVVLGLGLQQAAGRKWWPLGRAAGGQR